MKTPTPRVGETWKSARGVPAVVINTGDPKLYRKVRVIRFDLGGLERSCTLANFLRVYRPPPPCADSVPSILRAVPKPTRAAKAPKRLRPVNSRRRRAALAEDFGDLAVVARALPCCVVDCFGQGPSDPAHVRSRGAGHHAWLVIDGVRTGNIAPLCHPHHDEQGHSGIKTFEATHTLALRWWGGRSFPADSLAAVAAQLGRLVEDAP